MNYAQKLREEHKARRARLGLVVGSAIVPLSRVRPPQREPEPPPEPELFDEPPSRAEILAIARENYERRRIPDRVRISDIEEAVKIVFQITSGELCGDHRDRRTFTARSAAFWIARKMTNASYAGLGRYFNKDHTSVIHAVNTFPKRMHDDPDLAGAVESILTALGADE